MIILIKSFEIPAMKPVGGHLDEDDGYTVVEIIVPITPNKVK